MKKDCVDALDGKHCMHEIGVVVGGVCDGEVCFGKIGETCCWCGESRLDKQYVRTNDPSKSHGTHARLGFDFEGKVIE